MTGNRVEAVEILIDDEMYAFKNFKNDLEAERSDKSQA